MKTEPSNQKQAHAGEWICLPYTTSDSGDQTLLIRVKKGKLGRYQGNASEPLLGDCLPMTLTGVTAPELNGRQFVVMKPISDGLDKGFKPFYRYGLKAETDITYSVISLNNMNENHKKLALMLKEKDATYFIESSRLRELSTNAFTNILIMMMLMVVAARVMVSIPSIPSTVFLAFNITMVLLCSYCCLAVIRNYGSDEYRFGFNMKHTTWFKGLVYGVAWSIPIVAVMGFLKLMYMPGMWLTLAAPLSETLIYLIISVPIQEMVARGVLQTVLVKIFSHVDHLGDYSEWCALIMANLLFTIAHLHLGLGFSLASMMCGFVWGYLFKESKSLYAPIVSHFVAGFILCAWDMGAVLQHMSMASSFSAYTHFILANPWAVGGVICVLVILVLQSNDMTKLFNAGNQNLLKLSEEQKGVRSGFIKALSNVQKLLEQDEFHSSKDDEKLDADSVALTI